MYGKTFILITIALLLALEVNAEMVKKADLAGTWYPYAKSELSSVLDGYLSQARVEPINGDVKAIIVPHAGLIYSGPIAAYSYRAIQEKKYTTVLLLGFCHRKYFDGISVYKEGYFETPLGLLEVDSQLASEIISHNKKIVFYPEAFKDENSIELELPFIKKVLPNSKIVPIVFGTSNFSYCQMLADVLAEVLSKREDILLVVSTDMSHFHPYDEAKRIDLASIELLKNFRATEIYEKSTNGEQLFCGYMPITTVLLACEKIGIDKIVILKYANSGDTAGDKSRVVGYAAIGFYAPKEAIESAESMISRGLGKEEQEELLLLSRKALEGFVREGKVPVVEVKSSALNESHGAFVTLRKNGQLRGCMGVFEPEEPLWKVVQDRTIASASKDPRFMPVTTSELPEIKIEISVLSPPQKINNPAKIELGRHGVIIKQGNRGGVFLPQVATETSWDFETFMGQLCSQKAGLSWNCWKDPKTELYTFTAQVFP